MSPLNIEKCLLDIAKNTGETKKAVENIENDIDALFEKSREVGKDLSNLRDRVVVVETKLSTYRSTSLFSASTLLMIIKKWIGFKGN